MSSLSLITLPPSTAEYENLIRRVLIGNYKLLVVLLAIGIVTFMELLPVIAALAHSALKVCYFD